MRRMLTRTIRLGLFIALAAGGSFSLGYAGELVEPDPAAYRTAVSRSAGRGTGSTLRRGGSLLMSLVGCGRSGRRWGSYSRCPLQW